MNQETHLKVGRKHRVVIFKVLGRGTLRNSPPLEKLALAALNEGGVKKIIVDLEDCLYMDSTFMGALVGINSALLKKDNRKLIIANADDRNKHLLDNLGLSRIMELRNDLGKFEAQWELAVNEPMEPKSLAKHILTAHDYLGKMDAQNRARFGEVKRLLLESLSREKPPSPKD